MSHRKHLALFWIALLVGVVFAADVAAQVTTTLPRLGRPSAGAGILAGVKLDLQLVEVNYENGEPVSAIVQASLSLPLGGAKLVGHMILTQGGATIAEADFQNLSEAKVEAKVDLKNLGDICAFVDATAYYGSYQIPVKRSICLQTPDVVFAK
jgi:hypothetical protein